LQLILNGGYRRQQIKAIDLAGEFFQKKGLAHPAPAAKDQQLGPTGLKLVVQKTQLFLAVKKRIVHL
jgi:hypothetical protein